MRSFKGARARSNFRRSFMSIRWPVSAGCDADDTNRAAKWFIGDQPPAARCTVTILGGLSTS